DFGLRFGLWRSLLLFLLPQRRPRGRFIAAAGDGNNRGRRLVNASAGCTESDGRHTAGSGPRDGTESDGGATILRWGAGRAEQNGRGAVTVAPEIADDLDVLLGDTDELLRRVAGGDRLVVLSGDA